MSHAVYGYPKQTGHGPLEKGLANYFSILALRTPLTAKNQKDRTLKDELPRSVGAQYATGKEWRNNFRKNEDLSVSISKANHSIPQESKSMPQPVMLKKMKLNGSMKTYKTF